MAPELYGVLGTACFVLLVTHVVSVCCITHIACKVLDGKGLFPRRTPHEESRPVQD